MYTYFSFFEFVSSKCETTPSSPLKVYWTTNRLSGGPTVLTPCFASEQIFLACSLGSVEVANIDGARATSGVNEYPVIHSTRRPASSSAHSSRSMSPLHRRNLAESAQENGHRSSASSSPVHSLILSEPDRRRFVPSGISRVQLTRGCHNSLHSELWHICEILLQAKQTSAVNFSHL